MKKLAMTALVLVSSCVSQSKYDLLLSEFDKQVGNGDHHLEVIQENKKLKKSLIEHKAHLLIRQLQVQGYEDAHYVILQAYANIKEYVPDHVVEAEEKEMAKYITYIGVKSAIKLGKLNKKSADDIQSEVNKIVKYMYIKKVMLDDDYYEDKAEMLKLDLDGEREDEGEFRGYLEKAEEKYKRDGYDL